MATPVQNITVDQLENAADDNASEYAPMYQKVARAAFMEGVLWAIKVDEGKVVLQK